MAEPPVVNTSPLVDVSGPSLVMGDAWFVAAAMTIPYLLQHGSVVLRIPHEHVGLVRGWYDSYAGLMPRQQEAAYVVVDDTPTDH